MWEVWENILATRNGAVRAHKDEMGIIAVPPRAPGCLNA
jgi:hypothetical protein